MTLFNGRYSWDGTKKDNREPIAWFPGSYDLKILSRGDAKSRVKHLKQYTCIYSKTGDGLSISENPEKFGKGIGKNSVDLEKVGGKRGIKETAVFIIRYAIPDNRIGMNIIDIGRISFVNRTPSVVKTGKVHLESVVPNMKSKRYKSPYN